MKSAGLLSLVFTGACAIAFAQAPQDSSVPPVQAPPKISDPGVAPAAPKPTPPTTSVQPAPAKPAQTPGLPADVQAAANAAELPVITVRHNGSETVEEYRKRGKLYFVRVLSNTGPTRFYVDNPAVIPPNIMKQLSGPSGQVQPVYYKLAEWK
jgi:hypothetical protein